MWNITVEGSSEVYVRNDNKFVARFKYARPKSNAKHFVKFLTKNFTPEEYFAKMEAGGSPLGILKEKGYESLNMILANKLTQQMAA